MDNILLLLLLIIMKTTSMHNLDDVNNLNDTNDVGDDQLSKNAFLKHKCRMLGGSSQYVWLKILLCNNLSAGGHTQRPILINFSPKNH